MSNDFAPNDAASASGRKIRVVVVDDSAVGMAFLGHVLETFPRVQIVGQAHDGLEGFALAARLQPDLVLTDLHMPGRDGFQLVKLLRQKYPAIRSIITSAHDGPACHAACLEHGADAFISKGRLFEEFSSLLSLLFPETAETPRATCKKRTSRHVTPAKSQSRSGRRNPR
jgi:DNA-binding NarL/FixJ family response regulator